MQHISQGKISLVTHRDHIGRMQFRTLVAAMQHKGTTLADKCGSLHLCRSMEGQFFPWNKPGIIDSWPGDDAHTVGPKEHRPAIRCYMGLVNLFNHTFCPLAAGSCLPQATCNEHDTVGTAKGNNPFNKLR